MIAAAHRACRMPAKSWRSCWAILPITAASATTEARAELFESDYQGEALQALAWGEAPPPGGWSTPQAFGASERCRAIASTSSMTDALCRLAAAGRPAFGAGGDRAGDQGFRGEAVTLRGAGRTDAGVHAMAQVAHVDLDRTGRPIPCAMPSTRICSWRRDRQRARGYSVAADFDARFSAMARHYLYRILNRRAPLAMDEGKAWWVAEAARHGSHARRGPGTGGHARLHDLPLRPMPGEQPGQDAGPP